jgi:hypothetical protein
LDAGFISLKFGLGSNEGNTSLPQSGKEVLPSFEPI